MVSLFCWISFLNASIWTACALTISWKSSCNFLLCSLSPLTWPWISCLIEEILCSSWLILVVCCSDNLFVSSASFFFNSSLAVAVSVDFCSISFCNSLYFVVKSLLFFNSVSVINFFNCSLVSPISLLVWSLLAWNFWSISVLNPCNLVSNWEKLVLDFSIASWSLFLRLEISCWFLLLISCNASLFVLNNCCWFH